jgi:hypothetical protein
LSFFFDAGTFKDDGYRGFAVDRTFLVFRKGVVWITVEPALAKLRGGDNWMPGGVRVFGGMPVRRAITAERHATRLAGAQMDPLCADLHAFFAFEALRLLD